MRSDLELLRAWRAGDAASGNGLVTRHFAAVHRVFVGRVESHRVDDLLQRTFLAAVERRDDIFEASGFRAYVLGIARIQLLRHYREHRRDGRTSDIDSALKASDTTASSMVGRREQRGLLWDALRDLPLDQQLVLQLYYWEELSTPDIARVLDVAQGTVRSRLARARAALAEGFAERTPPQEVPAPEVQEAWFTELRDQVGG